MASKKIAADPKLFDDKVVQSIRKRLVTRRETISVAESVTAGLLQSALASAENASEFFEGGITAYNVGQKTLQLNIEPIEALASNCVSENTTCQMATNVSLRFRSHWGIAVTGYATPVPESNGKTYAWYAITHRGKIIESSKINDAAGSPLHAQLHYVNKILLRLSELLEAGESKK